MIRTIIESLIWIKNLDNSWSFVTNITTIISCLAGIATLAFAIITYRISQISKEIGIESKQVAIESKELAERAYNLEHEEPWKLTPIDEKEGYWILERVHRKFATIYGYCLLPNTAWQDAPKWRFKEINPTEIEIVDFNDTLKRQFFRGSKVIIRVPEVPIGSYLQIFFRTHSREEEAREIAEEHMGLLKPGTYELPSGVSEWKTPLY